MRKAKLNPKTEQALKDVLPDDCFEYCKEYEQELFKCEPHEIYQFVEWYPSKQEYIDFHHDLFNGDVEDYVSFIEDASFEGVLVVI